MKHLPFLLPGLRRAACAPARALVLALLSGWLLAAPAARAQAPAWDWVSLGTSPELYDYSDITATVADAQGNVYLLGTFRGQFTLGGQLLRGRPNFSETFVAKWSPLTQRYAWVKLLTLASSRGHAAGGQLALGTNCLYVTGTFNNDLALEGTTLHSAGDNDLYVLRLRDTGSDVRVEWAQALGGSQYDNPTALAVEGSSLYVGGYFTGHTRLGNSTFTVPDSLSGMPNAFLLKLTDTGTAAQLRWARHLGGVGYNTLAGLAVEGGTLYTAGHYLHEVEVGGQVLRAAQGGSFVASYADADAGPVPRWAHNVSEGDNFYVQALAQRGGSLYLAGGYNGECRVGSNILLAGSNWGDAFALKMTPTASNPGINWVVDTHGDGGNLGTAICVAPNAVYVAGALHNTVAAGGTVGFGRYEVQPVQKGGAFVARLMEDAGRAAYSWVQVGGGTEGYPLYRLAVSDTHLYLAGAMQGQARFGPYELVSRPQSIMGVVARLPDTGLRAPFGTLELSPNPAQGSAVLQLPGGGQAGPVRVSLLDAVGRTLSTTALTVPTTGLRYLLDVSSVAAGLYVVRVELASGPVSRKLVVE